MDKKQSKPWYKKWWVWSIIIVVFVAAASAGSPSKNQTDHSMNSATQKKSVSTKTPRAENEKPAVPAEYTSALSQADSYANTMHMSKQGVYDQLVSPYGGQFSAQAAQYAIDNVKADWSANALAMAKNYQDQQHLSPAEIHDQLTSQYGEKFTQSEADYAIAHLNN